MNSGAEQLETIAQWLMHSRSAVAFSGAGISTESGIPDFRSPGGVWSRHQPVYFDQFVADAQARHRYWQQKCEAHHDFSSAKPNTGHAVLAKWEKDGRLRGVITQNIDGLHQEAGSRTVVELHGTARHVACLSCEYREEADPFVSQFLRTNRVPTCPMCDGLLKHATISFGQMLSEDVLAAATRMCQECDLLLALGSSLVVTPAADLPPVACRAGARFVIMNREETALDAQADLVVRTTIGSALSEIDRLLA